MGTISILGASARAAAQSSLRAGLRVWAADLFADADLRACADVVQLQDYPHGLLAAIEQAPDAPWMYTGALENHPTLVDRLARRRPLLGCPGSVLRNVRDPRRLEIAVRTLGFRFPETRFDDFPAGEQGQWLCKPFRSAGGTHVRLAETGDNQPRTRRKRYFQRRVEGLPASAVFIGDGTNSVLVGVTRQWIGCSWAGAQGFQYAGSIGPLSLEVRRWKDLERLGHGLSEQFGLVGLFGVDLLLAGDGLDINVLEVNPRYTASVEVLERALDIHTIPWHLAACRGEQLPSLLQRGPTPVVGKVIAFATARRIVSDETAQRWLAESQRHSPPFVADIPHAGTQMESGQPICTLFAQGDNAAAVEQQLRDRARLFSSSD